MIAKFTVQRTTSTTWILVMRDFINDALMSYSESYNASRRSGPIQRAGMTTTQPVAVNDKSVINARTADIPLLHSSA